MSQLFPHISCFWEKREEVRSQLYDWIFLSTRSIEDQLRVEIHFDPISCLVVTFILNDTECFDLYLDTEKDILSLLDWLEDLCLSAARSQTEILSSGDYDTRDFTLQKLYTERLHQPCSYEYSEYKEIIIFNAYDKETRDVFGVFNKRKFIQCIYYSLLSAAAYLCPTVAPHNPEQTKFQEPLYLYNLFKSHLVEMYLDGRPITKKELKQLSNRVKIKKVLHIMPLGKHLFWDTNGVPCGDYQQLTLPDEGIQLNFDAPYLLESWYDDYGLFHNTTTDSTSTLPSNHPCTREYIWLEGLEAARWVRYLLPNDIDLLFLSWDGKEAQHSPQPLGKSVAYVISNYQSSPAPYIDYLSTDFGDAVFWDERLCGNTGCSGLYCDTPDTAEDFYRWYHNGDDGIVCFCKDNYPEHIAYIIEGMRITQKMRNNNPLDTYIIFALHTHVSFVLDREKEEGISRF